MHPSSPRDYSNEEPFTPYTAQAPVPMAHGHLNPQGSFGGGHPTVEVRLRQVSLAMDVLVLKKDSKKPELPTVFNVMSKNLAVKKQRLHHEILNDVSAVFRPGTMTLVLGPAGAGKTSLLKLLSGRLATNKQTPLTGDITYNDQPRKKVLKKLPQLASYVGQDDKHLATLTIKNVLDFAAKCGRSNQSDAVTEQVGLEHCQDCVVDDASSGELKRLTVGEMQFRDTQLCALDEITTGLDSATAFDIVRAQQHMARQYQQTVVMALVQPSREIFELFDNILLLNAGQMLFFGPRDQMRSYFEALGFGCPPTRNPADFLLDMGTERQSEYESTTSVQRYTIPRTMSEFVTTFRETSMHQQLMSEHDVSGLKTKDAFLDQKTKIHGSVIALTKRQVTIAMRFKTAYIARIFVLAALGLVLGASYYKVNPLTVESNVTVLFMMLLFMAFAHVTHIPTFMAAREVYYKQRQAHFFRTRTFMLSILQRQVPWTVLESIIVGSIVYWLCGFVSDVSVFGAFLAVLVVYNLAISGLFHFFASYFSHSNVATPFALLSILLFFGSAGFIITKDELSNAAVGFYWISPAAWSLRAMLIGQYRSDTFDVCTYDNVNYCTIYGGKSMGQHFLSEAGIPDETEWVMKAMVFLFMFFELFMIFALVALRTRRHERPQNVGALARKQRDENDGPEHTYGMLSSPKIGRTPSDSDATVVTISAPDENVVPVSLAFQDLTYSVPAKGQPKELLQKVSGYALPGTMTAVMGSSGAGKTTLFDVITKRKTVGKTTGKIFLNGYEATDRAIQRGIGYAEAVGVHCETSTFREALTFSAMLRQSGKVSTSQKLESVTKFIELFDMEEFADQIIRGSSLERMKRLTVAVEAVAQTSVLLLDEPTTGLDAHAAYVVMNGLRKLATSGRTVVCSIHQPSSYVLAMFDRMMVLQRGGEVAYFGDVGKDCDSLIKYFEAVPGVVRMTPDENPSTWVMKSIGAGIDRNDASHGVDFAGHYNGSELKSHEESILASAGVTSPSADRPEVVFKSARAASSFRQIRLVFKRCFASYWRTASHNLTRFFLAEALGIVVAMTFGGVKFETFEGVRAGVGLVFLLSAFSALLFFQSVLSFAIKQREVVYRELSSKIYNPLWYILGNAVAELPFVGMNTYIIVALALPTIGFSSIPTMIYVWGNLTLLVLFQTYLMGFFAYIGAQEEVVSLFAVLLNSILIFTTGIFPTAHHIPKQLESLYNMNPFRHASANILTLLFADCSSLPVYDAITNTFNTSSAGSEVGCNVMTNLPASFSKNMTVQEYVTDVYDLTDDSMTHLIGIVALLQVVLIEAALSVRFNNLRKR